MGKIKITQTRSIINKPKNQKLTIEALGLGKINKSVEVEYNDQIKGMVNTVGHLIKVTEL